LDAWKIENTVTTLNQGAFDLRIEGGGILATSANPVINGTGRLYAGAAVATAGTAELFIGGNNQLTVNSIISDNPLSGQATAVVKTGSAATLTVSGANTYTGGTYVTAGTLNVLTNTALGAAANQITLSGGTLQFNIPNAASSLALGGLGQSLNVTANSTIIIDNGALAGTDNDLAFGGINISGPYTLSMRAFDSMDATFTGTHTFAGTPTLDMAQAGSGSNPNTTATATVLTLSGPITGSGFFVSSSANTNDTAARLQIGGGAADAAPNTYAGKITLLAGSNSEDLFVELNKAPGTTAITGDLETNGGRVISNFDNQIADTSNVILNWGGIDFNGKNETVASVAISGGFFRTNFDGVAASNNTVRVTGDFNATATDDFNGLIANGIDVGSNSTLVVNGTLRLNGYSRATVGAIASNLIVGALELTGTTLAESGTGSLIRLNGDVTTFASSNTARLGNTTTLGAQVQLNGTRTFNVADGSAGLDLSVSTGLVDSTAPVAAGGLTKTGAGTMQLEGSSTVNSYTGPTRINQGTVVLFKNIGTNALGDGSAGNTLTIGDGVGGSKADQVIIRLDQQIADSTDVTIASSGLLDMATFKTTEIIGNLTGAAGAAITLGPTSTLTVTSSTDTIYSGSLNGGGTLFKDGAGTLYFDGNSQLNVETIIAGAGTLNFDSDVNNASVIVTGVVNFGVSQKINDLIIGDGAVVTLTDLPGPPPGPFPGAAGDALAGSVPVQAVPEPGTAALLLGGMLTMLGIRRRRV
jgi:autotransporter-associated beta strand protein